VLYLTHSDMPITGSSTFFVTRRIISSNLDSNEVKTIRIKRPESDALA
jgi:hypothetical protein